MGDCFSISLNITLKNEAAAVRVMQEYPKQTICKFWT